MAVHTPSTELGRLVGDALGPLPRVAAENVLLDLERARMGREDKAVLCALVDRNEALRVANSDFMSWREFVDDRVIMCGELDVRNICARATLERACAYVLRAATDPQDNHRQALIVVHNRMILATRELEPDTDTAMIDDARMVRSVPGVGS